MNVEQLAELIQKIFEDHYLPRLITYLNDAVREQVLTVANDIRDTTLDEATDERLTELVAQRLPHVLGAHISVHYGRIGDYMKTIVDEAWDEFIKAQVIRLQAEVEDDEASHDSGNRGDDPDFFGGGIPDSWRDPQS